MNKPGSRGPGGTPWGEASLWRRRLPRAWAVGGRKRPLIRPLARGASRRACHPGPTCRGPAALSIARGASSACQIGNLSSRGPGAPRRFPYDAMLGARGLMCGGGMRQLSAVHVMTGVGVINDREGTTVLCGEAAARGAADGSHGGEGVAWPWGLSKSMLYNSAG